MIITRECSNRDLVVVDILKSYILYYSSKVPTYILVGRYLYEFQTANICIVF